MGRALGLACCVAMVLVGCGGDDAPASGTTAGTTPTAIGTPTAGADAVVAMKVAPCTLITAAEVEAATGIRVQETRDTPPVSCVFDLGKEAGVAVFVAIEDGQGRMVGAHAVFKAMKDAVATGDAEPVAGLGQAAFYAPRVRGVAVDAGQGRFITVGVNGGFNSLQDPRKALIALAEAALRRL